jgi:plasmid stabilization system protein ParE
MSRDLISASLGDDFFNELESAYQAIIEFPRTWPFFEKGFRRFLLSKFPFSVIYRETDKLIDVVAVMHNSRKPGYWLSRI